MERKTHIMRVHHFARGQRSRSATRAWSENGKAGTAAESSSLAVPEPLISMLLLAQTFVQQCGEPTPIKTNLAKKKKESLVLTHISPLTGFTTQVFCQHKEEKKIARGRTGWFLSRSASLSQFELEVPCKRSTGIIQHQDDFCATPYHSWNNMRFEAKDLKPSQPQKIQDKAPATKDTKWSLLSFHWSNRNSFGVCFGLFVCFFIAIYK